MSFRGPVAGPGTLARWVGAGVSRREKRVAAVVHPAARSVASRPSSRHRRRLQPFFSPDGQWIGFFAEGKLKKVAVTGGAAVTICDALNPRGGAWGEDGDIVFSIAASVSSPRNSLLRVSSDSGTPQPATTLADDEVTHRWPQVLPGARAILYTAHNRANNYADANIVVQALPNGPRKILQRGGSFGRYVPSGHLVYMHDGTLFAAPFDHVALEVTGPGSPVIENIANQPATGAAQFAVAADGTAVYLPGQTSSTDLPIEWMTRDGKTTPLRATTAIWGHPQFSPDGTRLAMEIRDNGQTDIAVYDWAGDRLTPLTFGAEPDQYACVDSRRPAHNFRLGSRRGCGEESLLGPR